MPSLAVLNQLAPIDAEAVLLRCCGSVSWARKLAQGRPYSGEDALFTEADRVWNTLAEADWLEAFKHHPRIGEKQLREKFAGTAQWAEQEQRAASGASEQVLRELARGNQRYESRFGYVFLVCATGKTADEMLALLLKRIHNEPGSEIRTAAAEQAKITRIRLEKWLRS